MEAIVTLERTRRAQDERTLKPYPQLTFPEDAFQGACTAKRAYTKTYRA
jgi:hypothetical protein